MDENVLNDILTNAGSMTPIAIAFWFILKQLLKQADEDRAELRESRRLMMDVVRDNTKALQDLKSGLGNLCKFSEE